MLGQLHLPLSNGNNRLPVGLTAPLPPSFSDQFLKELTAILEKNFTNERFGALELSQALYLCPMQVHRKVKQRTGLSPGHLLLQFRLAKAQAMLRSTDLQVGEIAWRTGFGSQNYFARAYHKEMGWTPREERQRGMLELC